MGLLSKIRCWIGFHRWDLYRDPPQHYSLYYCPRCGMVSTPLGGRPTVAREPTSSEIEFLNETFGQGRRFR